jgi:hypothetical protein
MFDNELHEKLDLILRRLAQIKELLHKEGHVIMSALDDLVAKVQSESTVIDGAVTLLGQLSALVKAADPNNPKLVDLANQIDAKTQAIAAAITVNTPAAPPPPAP